jgi:hypothetical protein
METRWLLARVLARARLCEKALEEDLALRDQGRIDLAAAREQRAERAGPLDGGHLPGKRVGLLPGELAVRGEGSCCAIRRISARLTRAVSPGREGGRPVVPWNGERRNGRPRRGERDPLRPGHVATGRAFVRVPCPPSKVGVAASPSPIRHEPDRDFKRSVGDPARWRSVAVVSTVLFREPLLSLRTLLDPIGGYPEQGRRSPVCRGLR